MDKYVESKDQERNPKKSPFDDLSRDDLIIKCKGLLVIAQKAKQSKSELQNEVDQYKSQLLSYEKEIKSREDSLKTLQELVDSLTEQKLTFITEIDTAQSNIRALNNKCNIYEDELNKHRTELGLRDQNLASASQKLSDFDSEIISLKRQNNRLLEENEQLINQLTELEARTEEFNKIGLQQREQLKLLEERVQNDDTYQNKFDELESKEKVKCEDNGINFKEYEDKIDELTKLYEQEKSKKEKCNIKLRSYKDKILKCASCINQLKNSRFILAKTVKEYSESIPKWQNEIIKASNALDAQIKLLYDENISLKENLKEKENIESSLSLQTNSLNDEICKLNVEAENFKYQISELQTSLSKSENLNDKMIQQNNDLKVKEVQLDNQLEENRLLTDKINDLSIKLSNATAKSTELEMINKQLQEKHAQQQELSQNNNENKGIMEKLRLQIRALESEKATLVKEKLNVKDNLVEIENTNKNLTDNVDRMNSELIELRKQLQNVNSEYERIKKEFTLEKEDFKKQLKTEKNSIKEQYDKLKRQYDNLQDLNGLLQEEVETLKLSLEQPKDDTDNLSDVNVSLQADIVKLETKLSAYKQENVSLLSEVKESRMKIKDYDNFVAEYEEMKTKFVGFKSENSELLNEMKEINQALKERGEAISKLQKAVSEMEKLIETLEKDRDGVKEEKEDLLKKIEGLEKDLKSALENDKNSEVIDNNETEKDSLLTTMKEKDALISSLKEEIEKLKVQSCNTSVDFPNEDMSTSTISKAEEHSRMKDLDESFEDRYTKLRIFALKLKKKLNETITQLQNSEQEKANLKRMLAENCSSKQQSEDVVDSNKIGVACLEAQVKKLSTDLEASENINKKVSNLEAELATKSQQLDSEIERHKATREQLEKALKDVKKKKVLSLEMEDYERSLKELTTKMEEKKKKIIQMESTIDNQEGTITSMQTQIKLLQEQIKNEETQCRLLKEELQQAISDGKDKDSVINTKKDIITKLIQDIEDEKRKNEEADMEMTSVLSEKEKIIMHLSEEKIELGSRMKKLEFKCSEMEEKFKLTNIELADLKTEYTSYKVRAQAVLRQNQTVDHSQEEQLKEEAAALRAQIETLNKKMATLQEQLSVMSAEAEAGRKRATDAAAEVSRSQQRNARLHSDITRLSQQLDTERAQHKLQISTLTQCYKSQINDLEAKLQKETDNLKKQLSVLQENVKGRSDEESKRDKYLLPVIPKEEGSDNEMDINVSLIPREEGEGSESAPSPPLSKSMLSTRRSPVPLERLLEEGVPDNDSLDASSLSLTVEQEMVDLKRKVQAQQDRVKHVTVLLSESERERARLSQLSELLKGELRRARPPASAAHNTQYMKNVTLKFLTLPPGDERCRLVPVLQKILTLSSDETHKIQAIAKGQDPNPSKGWGSYLPWPGGK